MRDHLSKTMSLADLKATVRILEIMKKVNKFEKKPSDFAFGICYFLNI